MTSASMLASIKICNARYLFIPLKKTKQEKIPSHIFNLCVYFAGIFILLKWKYKSISLCLGKFEHVYWIKVNIQLLKLLNWNKVIFWNWKWCWQISFKFSCQSIQWDYVVCWNSRAFLVTWFVSFFPDVFGSRFYIIFCLDVQFKPGS
jgi:hypothetical protein